MSKKDDKKKKTLSPLQGLVLIAACFSWHPYITSRKAESYTGFVFGTVKQLEDLANLTKAYKAICKRLGVSTYGPFLQNLAACTEAMQPLSKVCVHCAAAELAMSPLRTEFRQLIESTLTAQVVCSGSSVDHVMVECMLEVLQGYAACRGLAFMGCSLDDEALRTVTGLLLKGCGKWWTGPKLQLLEITVQYHDQQSTGAMPFAAYILCAKSNSYALERMLVLTSSVQDAVTASTAYFVAADHLASITSNV